MIMFSDGRTILKKESNLINQNKKTSNLRGHVENYSNFIYQNEKSQQPKILSIKSVI